MADIYNVLANMFKKNVETIGIKVNADALANKVEVAVHKSNIATRIRENLVRDLQHKAQPEIRRQIFKGLTDDGNTIYKLETTRRMQALLKIIPMSKSYGALHAQRWINKHWGGDWYKYKAQLTSNRLRSTESLKGIDFNIENSYKREDLSQIRRKQRLRRKQGRTRVGEDSVARFKASKEEYSIYRVDALQTRAPKRRRIDEREENKQRKAWKEQGGSSADFIYKEPEKLRRPNTIHKVYVNDSLDITDHKKKSRHEQTVEGNKAFPESVVYKGRRDADGFSNSSFFDEQDAIKADLKKRGIHDPHATSRAVVASRMMRRNQSNTLRYSTRNGGKVYNVPYAKTGKLASALSKSFKIHKLDHSKIDGRSGVIAFKAIYSINPNQMPYDVQEAWRYSKRQYKSVVIEGTSDVMREYLFRVVADKFGEKYVR